MGQPMKRDVRPTALRGSGGSPCAGRPSRTNSHGHGRSERARRCPSLVPVANDTIELRLAASADEALKSLLDALPKDAVVRDVDDGAGRFAAERTVALLAPGKRRIMLFQGTWKEVSEREEQAMLEVVFDSVEQGVIARLTPEPERTKGARSHIGDLVSQAVTVGALVVAYHWWREIPIDTMLTVGIAVGGGVAWSVIGRFLPKSEERNLEELVRGALAPLEAVEEDEGAGEGAGEDSDEDEP